MKDNRWQISIILFLFILFSIFYFLFSTTLIPLRAQARTSKSFAQEVKESEGIEAEEGIVTIDFKDADIRNVLRILSHKSGVNIVAGEDVQGKVTIKLTDVPWEKALDVILKTYGFAYERVDNIIRVTTIEALGREALETRVFALNYARAEEATGSIKEMLSDRGKIKYDERTNLIIVTDIPTNLHKIGQVIQRLDAMTPQVMIEARIVKTTLTDEEKMGIDWEYRDIDSTVREDDVRFKQTLRSPLTLGGLLRIGTLGPDNYEFVLEALSERAETEILSTPRLTTLNNQEAEIVAGRTVYIPTYERHGETGEMQITGYEERNVGRKLVVTPIINPAGYITMKIRPEVSELIRWVDIGGGIRVPDIVTEHIETQVMVRDGETIVIGGLIRDDIKRYRKKVPLLGDIPLLGLLFQRKHDVVEKKDLIIFITPRIITGGHPLTPESTVSNSEHLLPSN